VEGIEEEFKNFYEIKLKEIELILILSKMKMEI
jgi:DNA/RNA endonuclease YhcR with UshA esterase domain